MTGNLSVGDSTSAWRLRGGRLVRLLAVLAVGLTGFVAAACGGADDEGGNGAAEVTTINVGVLPIVDVAPLYLGQRRGFFREEKLRVKPQIGESGAALLPAVMKGDLQFSYNNTVSLIIAGDRNLPVKIVAEGGTGGPTQEKDNSAILVRKDSDIRQPKDLEGKTFAVNAINNIATLTVNATLEKEGVDIEKIKYLEVPLPEHVTAIASGRVDAGQTVEPFVTLGKSQGLRVIAGNFAATTPNLTTAVYFTSERYIQENQDVVERFRRAMNRSLEYAQQHPDEAREILKSYTEIPPKVAQQIALPGWPTDLHIPTIELTRKLAERYGYVKDPPPLSELIWEGAQ